MYPVENGGGVVLDRGGAAGEDGKSMEELEQKVKDLEDVLVEGWEYNYDGEDPVPTLKVPAKPSEKEWLEHQVTHTPPKPWCKHCFMGRGTRRPHRTNVADVEPHEGGTQ